MRVITLRGRVNVWIIVLGRVLLFFLLRDVVRILCIFSFLSFLDTLFLYIRSCDHLQTYIVLIFFIYVDECFFHLPLHVLFLFSLYAHASYYLYAIYYFYFTQRCLDEFCLKYFKNTGCQSLLAINSFFAKFIMLGQILLYLTNEYELSDL